MCKRIGYLYDKIYDWDNLLLADKNARRGKKRFSYGVRHHDNNRIENLKSLQKQLINNSFKTSEYKVMTIKADRGKIRDIWKLPYFPDRILHHAIMQVIEPYLTRHFINDTYACVRGKGLNYGDNGSCSIPNAYNSIDCGNVIKCTHGNCGGCIERHKRRN